MPSDQGWPDKQIEAFPPPLSENATFPSSPVPDTEPDTAANPTGGPSVVSVGQLQHPVTSKGQRLLQRIQLYLHRGDRTKAQQEFKQALNEPSAAPYAHALIGTDYLKQGQITAAIPELERAAEALPVASIHSNLGYALSLTGETQHGQQELEEALRLDATSRQAQYVLGVILLNHRSQDHEAMENLRGAQQQVRAAYLALAVFYVRERNYSAAEQEIRGYLGPDHLGEFLNAWNWACLVAARPKPAAAFGLGRD
jgi:Tfp pilus assembly protein PilF